MTVKQIVLVGDSTTQGNTGGFNYALGGRGCWADIVTDALGNNSDIGPLVSSGIRGCHLGFTASGFGCEWTTQPASPTSVLSTDLFDKYPYTAGRRANGASKIWTWTKPITSRPIIGFALYYVDIGGNWQYRIDGGTWTNHNQSTHTNQIVKFYVSTPVTATVDIRASSDATTGVDTFPVGIEVYYLPPTTTNGLIIHNIAVKLPFVTVLGPPR